MLRHLERNNTISYSRSTMERAQYRITNKEFKAKLFLYARFGCIHNIKFENDLMLTFSDSFADFRHTSKMINCTISPLCLAEIVARKLKYKCS